MNTTNSHHRVDSQRSNPVETVGVETVGGVMVNGYWFPSLAAAADAPAGQGFDFAKAAAEAAAEAARAKRRRKRLMVSLRGWKTFFLFSFHLFYLRVLLELLVLCCTVYQVCLLSKYKTSHRTRWERNDSLFFFMARRGLTTTQQFFLPWTHR